MSKILITGGAGFIGLHLAEKLLKSGNEIHLLDNFARAAKDPDLEAFLSQKNVTLIEADLLDPSFIDKLDTDYNIIYHFAAIIGVPHVLGRPYEVLTKNVELLSNIIEFAKKQKNLNRLVFASTSEIYAGTLKYFDLPIPTPEDTPLGLTDLAEPRTSYMLSKIYGEAMCHHSKLPFTIIRPHNVYGPRMGMSHVVPILLERAYKLEGDVPLKVYSPTHKRTFCYVDDAVDLLERVALTPECEGVALNLGSTDDEITMETLALAIIKTTGKGKGLTYMPETEGSVPRRCPDMTKAMELTGYQSKVSLEEGLARTFEWYKQNIFEGHGITAD
ncbi:NAD-dependent epimerase/dehydratase family protein [Emcibacter nanhaiensis]|uniref:NAD-dependent epimerase/dehydratase family protein n=1 Tax=Emcibacter nanhaiensis TaxID=1505037 RepID=A0A501PB00_9PROT|nr:NAD-dependent epimerase/dehydratase family protein [Emcibacter nanhaiensis]TPD57405.1 NAD-dependent epimerase/dehydratase family protein [Emcibacter nanhaiensis]